jgi:hypothetical protein
MSIDNIDVWGQIIYDLNGTCKSIEQVLDEHNAKKLVDHLPFLHYLDNHIFLCDCCGWWCDVSEAVDASHGLVCDQCFEDDE